MSPSNPPPRPRHHHTTTTTARLTQQIMNWYRVALSRSCYRLPGRKFSTVPFYDNEIYRGRFILASCIISATGIAATGIFSAVYFFNQIRSTSTVLTMHIAKLENDKALMAAKEKAVEMLTAERDKTAEKLMGAREKTLVAENHAIAVKLKAEQDARISFEKTSALVAEIEKNELRNEVDKLKRELAAKPKQG